jgi:hypothetical protein
MAVGWRICLIDHLVLPFTVTILIPTLLLAPTGSFASGWGLPMPWLLAPIAAGLLCLSAGRRLFI